MNKKTFFIILLLALVFSASLLISFNFSKPKDNVKPENEETIEKTDIPESIVPTDNISETYIINNGKNATEYNGKLYFNNYAKENPYSNITICETDLKGNTKPLLQNSVLSNINIYNNKIYTTKQTLDLSNNTTTTNPFPITYIDEKITIYTENFTDINHVYNTPDNSYNAEDELFNFTGKFIERIDDTIYFYKNGVSRTYLYSANLTNNEIICIDDTLFEEIFEDYYDEYSEYTISIVDIEKLNDTIIYCIGCYQGSGHFWHGNIIKINSNGSSKTFLEKGSDVNSLIKDSLYIYYGNKAYSTVSNTIRNKTLDIKDEYTVQNVGNEIYLMKLNSDKKAYSRNIKITDNYENFSSLYDLVIFDDYIIAYLEYRNFNEGGWRGIPSMYVYYIKKDGSEIICLNENT